MCLRLLVVSVAILARVQADPVSFIQKCTYGDSKCIKEATGKAIPMFAMGIPELGVKGLDPMTFKKLDASSNNLKLVVRDITFKGFKNCKPKKISRNETGDKIVIKLLCDIEGNGVYEMKGSLLVIPMEGKGKIDIKLNKMLIGAEMEIGEKVGKDNKKYWNIKSWTHSYELKGKADVNFENLFPGNELLGRAAREVVASSGNEIINEVGSPIIKDVAKEIVETINDFFHKVPAEDLTLD